MLEQVTTKPKYSMSESNEKQCYYQVNRLWTVYKYFDNSGQLIPSLL